MELPSQTFPAVGINHWLEKVCSEDLAAVERVRWAAAYSLSSSRLQAGSGLQERIMILQILNVDLFILTIGFLFSELCKKPSAGRKVAFPSLFALHPHDEMETPSALSW